MEPEHARTPSWGSGNGEERGIFTPLYLPPYVGLLFFPLEVLLYLTPPPPPPLIISPSMGPWQCGGDSSRGTRAARRRWEAERQRSCSRRLRGRKGRGGGFLYVKPHFN